jgi:hypothetical protein
MNVGVFRGVVPEKRIEYGLRLLTGSRVVKIDEGLTANLLLQGREIFPDSVNVKWGFQGWLDP